MRAIYSRMGGRKPVHHETAFFQRLVAYATLGAILSGCATPQQGGANYSSSGSASSSDPSTPTLQVSQKDHDPCSEASKRSEAFAGAIVGGILGAAVGAGAAALMAKLLKTDARQAALGGGVAGLAIGALAGYNSGIDSYRRQCDLFKVAERRNTKAAFATLTTGKETTGEIVVTPDQGHFALNSDQLTPVGRAYFSDLGSQYTSQVQLASYERTVRLTSEKNSSLGELKSYTASPADRAKLEQRWRNYRIVITGHTDDQRDAAAAQDLSERRARNVANLFREGGVPESSLFYQGAGASFPIADNRSAIGRQKNNRVEAIVLYDEKTLLAYADARASKYEYFSERTPDAAQPLTSEADSSKSKVEAPKNAAKQTKAAVTAPPKPTTPPKVIATKPTGSTAQPTKKPLTQLTAMPPPAPVEPGIDLGGVPIANYSSSLAARLGAIKISNDGLMIDTFATLIGAGTAYATSNTVIQSCSADDAQRHRPGQIKKLSDGSAIAKTKPPISVTDSYLFSTVRLEFYSPAGDHFVQVKNVTAKKTGELVEVPQFNIYLNYRTKSDEEKVKSTVADFSTASVSYSLLGEGGLLIRQFFPRERGLDCMDMLIPNDRRIKDLQDTALVYTDAGVRKVANLTMERKK